MAEARFDGRVAVVTGAGRGLGREYARLLASRGAKVVVNDLGGAMNLTGESEEPAESVANLINDAGGEAVADFNTVATEEGGAAIVQTALDAFGRVDIVINNAGGVGADLATTLAVHLQGAVWVVTAAWPYMGEQGYGRVLNTTSAAGIYGTPGDFENPGGREVAPLTAAQFGYGSAKMGLVGFTRQLAHVGAASGIKVNALAPVAHTRMTQGLSGPLGSWLREQARPELVAPAVVWLVHEDCPVSGEIYTAGAGRVARVFIAEAKGYTSPDLTVEDVRDHFDRIRDEADAHVFVDTGEQLSLFMRDVRDARAGR